MTTGYKWHPITDFEGDPQALTDGELAPLWRIWQRQKQELSEQGTLSEFEQRLRREWSIETGVIEDVYTLSHGVTRTLIEKGIDAALIGRGETNKHPVLVARVIQDHYEALEGMFGLVKGERPLTVGYIKELHAALLRNQDTHEVVDQFGKAFEKPTEKGKYKSLPNSVTRPDGLLHEYCPPEHTSAEMDEARENVRGTSDAGRSIRGGSGLAAPSIYTDSSFRRRRRTCGASIGQPRVY